MSAPGHSGAPGGAAAGRPDRPRRLSLVVAVADNGVIGRDGDLPWSIPSELQWFKRQTLGKPMIMGRRTFRSIGRPLPGRRNIVLTRQRDWRAEGVEVAPDLDAALALVAGADEAAVIGGAGVFADALPLADRLIWTAVHAAPEGDTAMPAVDWSAWAEVHREAHPADGPAPAYDCLIFDRRRG
ncbi:hypothetical protein CCR85_01690 [Rhodothalassium salexigens]|uniref:dihydrofolate reductase n=1 Tax=Rhodothalassium salexigens TaxID=1086 RepID=UPI001913300B|nr:dihydrofolate reductase [Rhodothalassium salexigens]MBK5910204.1 hypothetical protein [Rhodothalassium salexigens]MBK5920846.1 hypothetical protein [Rhodothalassium salexigens]